MHNVKQDRQCTYKLNNGVGAVSNCSRRKQKKNVTYSDCAFVALDIQHEIRTGACRHLGPVWLYDILHYYLKKQHDFRGWGWWWGVGLGCGGGGGELLNIKYVFWFSLQCLSEIFLILRKIKRHIIKTVHRSSCKVPSLFLPFLMKF